MWREGLGAYKIITENKKGYSNHPATKEFACAPNALYSVLALVRIEMLKRGYHPKELPAKPQISSNADKIEPWQSLEYQIDLLNLKACKCRLSEI